MKYKNIRKAVFKSRPNRFIAICEVDGEERVCHVRNTGRCRELLVCGVTVYLEESENPNRKTKYDLVAVDKKGVLFNIDSQAPNAVFCEWIKNGGFFESLTLVRPETKYNDSRFDFYVEYSGKKAFVEVKGVTLEADGVLLFPDAPTERGVKHLNCLCRAVSEGYEGYVFFVVQTENARYFTPNKQTHPEFANALKVACNNGVQIKCVCCKTAPDSLEISDFVNVMLQ